MQKKQNVYESIKRDERFTILSKILESTGIGEAMKQERETFTFFAPTDTAFLGLSEKALRLLTSPEGAVLVAAILGQHIIPKTCLYSNDLRRRHSVRTLHGNELKIKPEVNGLRLGEAHILLPGVVATNAVFFPVDKVLPARRKTAFA